MKKVLLFLLIAFIGLKSWGQTNNYLGLDGGFEGSATIDNSGGANGTATGKWTKSNSNITIAKETSTVRSGNNSIKISSSSGTLGRLYSPQITISASTTKWVIQCYRRATSTSATVQFQLANIRGGAEQANGSYAAVSAANTWEKVTYAPGSTTSATTAVVDFLAKMNSSAGDVYLDDIAIYESSSGVDNAAPNSASAVTITSNTGTSLNVGWTAASGGVDGGGYMVVRNTTGIAPTPNVNGIYAVNNSVGAGNVVAYVGTGTSFIDASLTPGTTYYYYVFTYDKAYNYAAEVDNNATPNYSITWTGASSSWSTASNWNTNAVPTAADNVLISTAVNQPVIGTGDNITVNSITIQNGTSLTLSGTGTLTSNNAIIVNEGGALIGNSSNVSGTVTLQQNFVGQRGWRVLANPFTTATTIATVASGNNIAISTTPSGASGLTDSRTYDNSATPTVTAWANVTASSWAANTAYALFYRGTNAEVTGSSYTSGPAGQTYSVSGTLNGATTTITPLVGDGTSFNLIGNPYAAPVTTQALTGGVAAPYTVYQISVSGDGRTKNGGWVASLTSSTSNTIPVLGVIAYQPSNTTLVTITAATDINPGGTLQTGLFGTETVIKNLELIVNNSNGEYQDKLFVRTGTDKNKLSKFANDNVNFYTVNGNNERLAIDSREQLSGTIPLGINGLAGSYILNVANNNLENVTVYLKDKLTNTQTELTPGTNYNFEITGDAATKGEGRFTLVFSSKTLSTLPGNTTGGFTAKLLSNVITNNQPIQVQVQNASANAVIQVKDVNGRAIATQAAVNGLNTINVSRASLGMYIVQTTDGNNVITDKVIKQ